MEKEKHQICYCAGRAECHKCYHPFGEPLESLSKERIEYLETLNCDNQEKE